MMQHTQVLTSRRDHMIRWLVLASCLTPLVGAHLYNLGFRLTDGKCLFQKVFGIPSPSCGMTRSFMAIARGDWTTALSFHAFGPLLFASLLFIAIYTSVELLLGRSYKVHRLIHRSIPSMVIVTVIVLFFLYYGLRLYLWYQDPFLTGRFFQTPFWQGLVTGAQAL